MFLKMIEVKHQKHLFIGRTIEQNSHQELKINLTSKIIYEYPPLFSKLEIASMADWSNFIPESKPAIVIVLMVLIVQVFLSWY